MNKETSERTTPLTELFRCTHSLEWVNQCASRESPEVFQCCGRCGSFRWLSGPVPSQWQRPHLLEQTLLSVLKDVSPEAILGSKATK